MRRERVSDELNELKIAIDEVTKTWSSLILGVGWNDTRCTFRFFSIPVTILENNGEEPNRESSNRGKIV